MTYKTLENSYILSPYKIYKTAQYTEGYEIHQIYSRLVEMILSLIYTP